MSTTLSAHSATPNVQTVSPFGAVLDLVKKLFLFATTSRLGVVAENEIWQLYSMSRGRDSVSPAVTDKLSKIAVTN